MEKPSITIIPLPLSSTFRRVFVLAELITLFLEKVVVGLSPAPPKRVTHNLYFLRRFFRYSTLEILAQSAGPAVLLDLLAPRYGSRIVAELERFNPALEIRLLDAGEQSTAGAAILAGHPACEILVLSGGALVSLAAHDTAKPHGRARLAARATGLNQIAGPMLFYITLWLTLPATAATALAYPALINFGLFLTLGLFRSIYAARASRITDVTSEEDMILADEFPWAVTLLFLAVILAAGSWFVAFTPVGLLALASGMLACLGYVVTSRRRSPPGILRATRAGILLYLQFAGFDLARESSIVATHSVLPATAALFVVNLDKMSRIFAKAIRSGRAHFKTAHSSLALLAFTGLLAVMAVLFAVSATTGRLAIDLPGLMAAVVLFVASSPNRAVLSLRIAMLAVVTLLAHVAEMLLL